MCIGIPMQVVAVESLWAYCRQDQGEERVDLSLVGEVAVGEWLLVYKGAARECLDAERAQQILQAVQALAAVQRGEDFEHLFADLIGREPTLPEHLRN